MSEDQNATLAQPPMGASSSASSGDTIPPPSSSRTHRSPEFTELSLDIAGQVDALCDRFEQEWQAGRRPVVEEYLASAPAGGRGVLLKELLRVEVPYRRRSAGGLNIDEYFRRFPSVDADWLRELASAGNADVTTPDPDRAADNAGRGSRFCPPSAGNRPELLSGYTVIGDSPLGEGGMGVVWKAVQLSTKRTVALKVMSAAGLGSERARLRFEREVELTAKLDHPHIARVYDSGLERGICFYAMELIDGRTLNEHVKAERLSRRGIIELMKVICRAVQYAHQKGIIHRDLKPSNIVVDRQGEPHILDFGLAKALETDQQLSLEGQTAGTPAYMSPEQAGGRLDKLDTRSDVYTLGVIIFHLLTGQFPHDTRGSLVDVMSRIAKEEPRRLREVDAGTDRELDALVSKAMEIEPERRYDSAGALADDLERYLNHEPLNARPPTLTYILRKKLRRYRVQAATAGAVLLLAMGGAIWAYAKIAVERNVAVAATIEKDKQRAEALRQSNIAQSKEALAQRNAEEARHRLFEMCIREGRKDIDDCDAPLALLWFTQALDAAGRDMREETIARTYIGTTMRYGMQGQLLAAPLRQNYKVNRAVFNHDGSRVATIAIQEARVWETATGRPISPVLDDVCMAAFSPDGKKMLVGGAHAARILDTTTWQSLTPPLPHGGMVVALAFSHDGSKVVTGSHDHTARIWNAGTGEPLTDPLKHGFVVFQAGFNRDGTLLVTADGSARIWDAQSGRPIAAMGKGGQIVSAEFNADGTKVITAGNQLRLWESATGKAIGAPLMDGGNLSMCLSPDGTKVAAGSVNRAQVLDATTGVPIGPPLGRGGVIGPRAYSPDGSRLVIIGADESARIWDASTSRLLAGPLGHNGDMLSASFSPDGLRVITTGGDHAARIWNAAARLPRQRPWGIRFSVNTVHPVAFSADARTVIVCQENSAMVWDAITSAPVAPVLRHGRLVDLVAIDPGGTRAATATFNNTAHLWNARTGQPIGPPLTHGGKVNALAFSPDATMLATASDDNTARLWDAATGQSRVVPLQHKERVTSVFFSRDAGRLLTTTPDGYGVWDTASGNRITFVKQDTDTSILSTATFTPDEKRILLVRDATATLWDLSTSRQIGAAMSHDSPINSATFSRDGAKIVTAGDKTARIWDAATGKPLALWLRHEDEVNHSAISPDGRRIITSCWDGTARLWDAATGQPIAVPLPHDGTVLAAAFAPDGQSIVTAANFATDLRRQKPTTQSADSSTLSHIAVRRWNLTPDARPPADLHALAECFSARRVHPSGGVVQIADAELAGLFAAMKPKYPEAFVPGSALVPGGRGVEGAGK